MQLQMYSLSPEANRVSNPVRIALNLEQEEHLYALINNYSRSVLYLADYNGAILSRVGPGRVAALPLASKTLLQAYFGPTAGAQNYNPQLGTVAIHNTPITAGNSAGNGFSRQAISQNISGAGGTTYYFLGFGGTSFTAVPNPPNGAAQPNLPPGKKSHLLYLDSTGAANQPTSYSLYAAWQSVPLQSANPLPGGGIGEPGSLLQAEDFRQALTFAPLPSVTHPVQLAVAWPAAKFAVLDLMALGLQSVDYGYLSILFGLASVVVTTEVIEWWDGALPLL